MHRAKYSTIKPFRYAASDSCLPPQGRDHLRSHGGCTLDGTAKPAGDDPAGFAGYRRGVGLGRPNDDPDGTTCISGMTLPKRCASS